MSINVYCYLGNVGDVAGVDRSAVDDLKEALFFQGVQWQVVVLGEVLVDEGKTESAVVDQ